MTPRKFEGNWLLRGDALAGLRELQHRSQLVDMIYIDPPYNTGNAFAYHDRRDAAQWVAMMRERLLAAREVMASDALLFISIDFNELSNLKNLCDEVFGAENLVANFVWVSNLKGRQLGAGPAGTHEYILTYARDARQVGRLTAPISQLTTLMPAVYHLPKREVKRDELGEYVTKNELYNTNSKFNEQTSPSLVFAIHYHPGSGKVAVTDIDEPAPGSDWVTALPHPNARPGLRWHAWRWSRARVVSDCANLEFVVQDSRHTPRLRIYTKVRDFATTAVKDLIMGPALCTRAGQLELQRLGLGGIFETPKPTDLLRLLIDSATDPGDTVLDFFAGSGSTGAAAARHGRNFILVQTEEPFAAGAAQGLKTIADLTAERLRRDGIEFRQIRITDGN